VLNQPRYAGASILLARKNFGCGSRREHAPWALDQYGFRASSPRVTRTFFSTTASRTACCRFSCLKRRWQQLFDEVAAFPGYSLTVDLERQVIVLKPQGDEIPFEVQAFRKYCLLNGFDDIGLTLRHRDEIKAFEASD
jgi:3-isopropylmalate/(R)-2-methylmalate dehydratase small subunit